LNADQVLNLFMNLFGMVNKAGLNAPAITNHANLYSRPGEELTDRITSTNSDIEHGYVLDEANGPSSMSTQNSRPVSNLYDTYRPMSLYDMEDSPNYGALIVNNQAPSHDDSTISAGDPIVQASPVQSATHRLAEALQKLRHVDMILDQLGIFWAHTELVLDSLTKKGQHVEQFIGFSQKPRLMARFRERIEEYKRFWESISIMCTNYVNGVQQHTPFSESSSEM
jgi:hypothetical protein